VETDYGLTSPGKICRVYGYCRVNFSGVSLYLGALWRLAGKWQLRITNRNKAWIPTTGISHNLTIRYSLFAIRYPHCSWPLFSLR
jgi:hypothetical protein